MYSLGLSWNSQNEFPKRARLEYLEHFQVQLNSIRIKPKKLILQLQDHFSSVLQALMSRLQPRIYVFPGVLSNFQIIKEYKFLYFKKALNLLLVSKLNDEFIGLFI